VAYTAAAAKTNFPDDRPALVVSRAVWRHLWGVGFFSAFINILALTGSLFMLQVYDRILPSGSVPTLVVLFLLAAALFAFYGLLDLFRGRVLLRIGTLVDAILGPEVYEAIVKLPLSRVQQENKADPLYDLDAVRTFLSSSAPAVLFDLPWVPFYLALLYLFHPLLGGLALVGIVVLVAVMLVTGLLTRAPTGTASLHAKERQRLADTSRRNAELLTSLGMTRRYGERWAKINNRYMESHQRASDVSGGLGALSRALRMMLQSAVLALGAYLVIYQEATAGIIIAGSILTGRALAPLDAAIPNAKNWTAARQSWKRLSQILQYVAERRIVLPLRSPRERVTVETASVAPPGVTKLVVEDAAFTLTRRQGLGIIGPSGSGKSSLARLLVGVWKPVRGRVQLDGAALDQWEPEQLGRHIGYLPQLVELLPGSISDNIARFESEIDPESVIRAAEAAGVHDLIVSLPEGYQTVIGENGASLSAGQLQRIALARALYREPFLVVLDEPNSNLDVEGEAALTRAVFGIRERGGIVVIIAHHPSVLAAVDSLLVMKEGRILALGPKDEILPKVLRPMSATTAPLRVVGDATKTAS
jgi:ATP-binding cassette subfamily C protein PrsD